MPPYESYNIVELVTDDFFLESCLRPTVKSEQFWKEWCASSTQRAEIWQEGRAIILSLAQGRKNYALVRLPEEKVEALWQRIKSAAVVEAEPRAVRPLWSKPVVWIAAASVVLVIVALNWLFWRPQRPLSAQNAKQFLELATQSLRESHNVSNAPQTVKLSDGSSVVLFPDAKIQHAERFESENRAVYLSGEAVFDVTHDAKRPFLVYTNDLVTKVLGTKFKVTTDSKITKISVISGKVSVVRRQELKAEVSQAFILLPNQQVVYNSSYKGFSKTLVEKPVMINKPPNLRVFSFEDTPVSSVFAVLEKAYGIKVIYNESAFASCTITSTLTSQSLYVKLDLICETIHARYEVVDGQIVISGEGCQ